MIFNFKILLLFILIDLFVFFRMLPHTEDFVLWLHLIDHNCTNKYWPLIASNYFWSLNPSLEMWSSISTNQNMESVWNSWMTWKTILCLIPTLQATLTIYYQWFVVDLLSNTLGMYSKCIFSSNQIVHKISFSLCCWASDNLINKFN